MLSYQIVINMPFMTYEQYLQLLSMPKRTIMDGWQKANFLLKSKIERKKHP